VASIGSALTLNTPDGAVAMNNKAQGLIDGAAVQLFTPTQDFALSRDGKRLDTSATLVSQRADQTVGAARLFTPTEGQTMNSVLAVAGLGTGMDGQSLRTTIVRNAALHGPLAALFPQLRRSADGQWDMDALRRTNPLSKQTEAVGELEF
jgi:hypothetical protein